MANDRYDENCGPNGKYLYAVTADVDQNMVKWVATAVLFDVDVNTQWRPETFCDRYTQAVKIARDAGLLGTVNVLNAQYKKCKDDTKKFRDEKTAEMRLAVFKRQFDDLVDINQSCASSYLHELPANDEKWAYNPDFVADGSTKRWEDERAEDIADFYDCTKRRKAPGKTPPSTTEQVTATIQCIEKNLEKQLAGDVWDACDGSRNVYAAEFKNVEATDANSLAYNTCADYWTTMADSLDGIYKGDWRLGASADVTAADCTRWIRPVAPPAVVDRAQWMFYRQDDLDTRVRDQCHADYKAFVNDPDGNLTTRTFADLPSCQREGWWTLRQGVLLSDKFTDRITNRQVELFVEAVKDGNSPYYALAAGGVAGAGAALAYSKDKSVYLAATMGMAGALAGWGAYSLWRAYRSDFWTDFEWKDRLDYLVRTMFLDVLIPVAGGQRALKIEKTLPTGLAASMVATSIHVGVDMVITGPQALVENWKRYGATAASSWALFNGIVGPAGPDGGGMISKAWEGMKSDVFKLTAPIAWPKLSVEGTLPPWFIYSGFASAGITAWRLYKGVPAFSADALEGLAIVAAASPLVITFITVYIGTRDAGLAYTTTRDQAGHMMTTGFKDVAKFIMVNLGFCGKKKTKEEKEKEGPFAKFFDEVKSDVSSVTHWVKGAVSDIADATGIPGAGMIVDSAFSVADCFLGRDDDKDE